MVLPAKSVSFAVAGRNEPIGEIVAFSEDTNDRTSFRRLALVGDAID